jgi:hypothetical protein
MIPHAPIDGRRETSPEEIGRAMERLVSPA